MFRLSPRAYRGGLFPCWIVNVTQFHIYNDKTARYPRDVTEPSPDCFAGPEAQMRAEFRFPVCSTRSTPVVSGAETVSGVVGSAG